VGELELEALGFAMAFEAAAEAPEAEAAAVVEALAGLHDPHADAALRALALYARGPLRNAAQRRTSKSGGSEPPSSTFAAQVGVFEVGGVWRARSREVAVDMAWLVRPGEQRQAFVAVTGADDLGAPLLGGGMSSVPAGEGIDHWLDAVVASLGTAAPEPSDAAVLLGALRRGAETNAAVLVESSLTLSMGARLAAHALGGASDAVPALPFVADDAETDDDRAAYVQRLLLHAREEGVDPADTAALTAWFTRFRDRRPAEQLKRLGLTRSVATDRPEPPRRRDGPDRRAKRKAARKARKRNR
jgi:hypothetical protein